MKTLLFFTLFSAILVAQDTKESSDILFKTKMKNPEKTFFVYEKGGNYIFSAYDYKTQKEQILNFCSFSLYLEYLSKSQKEKKEISYSKALENISNPKLFQEFLNLKKNTLVLTTIY